MFRPPPPDLRWGGGLNVLRGALFGVYILAVSGSVSVCPPPPLSPFSLPPPPFPLFLGSVFPLVVVVQWRSPIGRGIVLLVRSRNSLLSLPASPSLSTWFYIRDGDRKGEKLLYYYTRFAHL